MSNDHAYLTHIQDSLHEVQTFIQSESYESFLENRMVQNAVMRAFEVSARQRGASAPNYAKPAPRRRDA